jgi:hypothetical protein
MQARPWLSEGVQILVFGGGQTRSPPRRQAVFASITLPTLRGVKERIASRRDRNDSSQVRSAWDWVKRRLIP